MNLQNYTIIQQNSTNPRNDLLTSFERRQRLLEILRTRPGLRVPELAALLDVSQGTVRNDLAALAGSGLVNRVHGGAVLPDLQQPVSHSFINRSHKNESTKLVIARQAAELVADGDSILLDSSTSVYCMARFLKDRSDLRVITNGIEVARQLAANPSNTVILVGGVLNPDGSSITGPLGEQFFQGLHIQKAFVSGSGFTLEAGLTEVHIYEAQLKSRAIAAASAVFALVDSTKLGKVDLTPFLRPDQITFLITDNHLSPAWMDQLKQSCLDFMVCAPDGAISFKNHSIENQQSFN